VKVSFLSPSRVFVCLVMATALLTAAEQPVPTKTIYQAATLGDIDQIKLHIARGTDLNKPDPRGTTALARAAQRGRLEIVKALVEAGANVDTTTPQGPPLFLATINRHADVAEFLLANDANPNGKDRTGRTALIVAAENAQQPLVELLVAKGADVNAADKQGHTPLTAAKRGRSDDIADFLRQKGAKEPVNDYRMDPYGRPGMASGATDSQSASYRSNTDRPDVLDDPNAIRARIAAVSGLAVTLKAIDANATSEERGWASRRSDNRTTLIRTVSKQFAEEMAFLKTVAATEKAPKTSAAIDELLVKRTERYGVITAELRDARRLALQEMRQTASAGRGRSTGRSGRGGRSRGSRQAGPDAYADSMNPGQTGPYGPTRPARPSARAATEPAQPALSPTTESQLQAWLGADPQDKRGLLAAAHDVDLLELDALHQTASEEQASQTVAAIEGLMLARQGRIERITIKMAQEDERLQRLAERNGGALNPTSGRRGRGSTQQLQEETGTVRRGRRGR